MHAAFEHSIFIFCTILMVRSCWISVEIILVVCFDVAVSNFFCLHGSITSDISSLLFFLLALNAPWFVKWKSVWENLFFFFFLPSQRNITWEDNRGIWSAELKYICLRFFDEMLSLFSQNQCCYQKAKVRIQSVNWHKWHSRLETGVHAMVTE